MFITELYPIQCFNSPHPRAQMLRTHSARVVAHFSSLKAVAKWVFPRARARNPDREDWTMGDSSSRHQSSGTNHYRGNRIRFSPLKPNRSSTCRSTLMRVAFVKNQYTGYSSL